MHTYSPSQPDSSVCWDETRRTDNHGSRGHSLGPRHTRRVTIRHTQGSGQKTHTRPEDHSGLPARDTDAHTQTFPTIIRKHRAHQGAGPRRGQARGRPATWKSHPPPPPEPRRDPRQDGGRGLSPGGAARGLRAARLQPSPEPRVSSPRLASPAGAGRAGAHAAGRAPANLAHRSWAAAARPERPAVGAQSRVRPRTASPSPPGRPRAQAAGPGLRPRPRPAPAPPAPPVLTRTWMRRRARPAAGQGRAGRAAERGWAELGVPAAHPPRLPGRRPTGPPPAQKGSAAGGRRSVTHPCPPPPRASRRRPRPGSGREGGGPAEGGAWRPGRGVGAGGGERGAGPGDRRPGRCGGRGEGDSGVPVPAEEGQRPLGAAGPSGDRGTWGRGEGG